MKTILSIEFHSDASGTTLEQIAKMAARHNGGKSLTSLPIIDGWTKAQAQLFGFALKSQIVDETLLISYDEKPFITITEKTYIGEISETTMSEHENY